MPIDLYSSTLKPFIIPLGFTVTATICLLMTLKKCMRGYVLCRQLSCQNFSFYFVLNLDTGPINITIITCIVSLFNIICQFISVYNLNPSRVQISSIHFLVSTLSSRPLPTRLFPSIKKDFPQDFIYLLTIASKKVLCFLYYIYLLGFTFDIKTTVSTCVETSELLSFLPHRFVETCPVPHRFAGTYQ